MSDEAEVGESTLTIEQLRKWAESHKDYICPLWMFCRRDGACSASFGKDLSTGIEDFTTRCNPLDPQHGSYVGRPLFKYYRKPAIVYCGVDAESSIAESNNTRRLQQALMQKQARVYSEERPW